MVGGQTSHFYRNRLILSSVPGPYAALGGSFAPSEPPLQRPSLRAGTSVAQGVRAFSSAGFAGAILLWGEVSEGGRSPPPRTTGCGAVDRGRRAGSRRRG